MTQISGAGFIPFIDAFASKGVLDHKSSQDSLSGLKNLPPCKVVVLQNNMPLTETPKENRKDSQTSHDVRPVPVDCGIRVAEEAALLIPELHERIGDSLAQLGYQGEYWLTAGFRTDQQDFSSTHKPVEEIHVNLANPLRKRASKIRASLSPFFLNIPGVLILQRGVHELRLELPNGSSWTKERVAPDVGRKDHVSPDSTAPTSEPTATITGKPFTSATQGSRTRSGNSPNEGSSHNERNQRRFGEEGKDQEGHKERGEGGEEGKDQEGHKERGEGGEEGGGEDEGGEDGGDQDPNEDDQDPSSHMDSQVLAKGSRICFPLYSIINVKPEGELRENLKFTLAARVTVEVNNNLVGRDYPFGDASVRGPWAAVDVHRFKAFFESISDRSEEKLYYPEYLKFDASTTPISAFPWWDPNEHVVQLTTQRHDRNRALKYLLRLGAKPSAGVEASHGTTISKDITTYPFKSWEHRDDNSNRVHAYVEYTKKDETKLMDVLPPLAPQMYFTYTNAEVQGDRQLVIKTSTLWSSRREWRPTGDSHPPLLYHNFTHEMKCELDLNALYNDEGLYGEIPNFVDSIEDLGIINQARRDFEVRTVEVGSNKLTFERSIVGEVNPARRGWKRFFGKK